MKMLEGIKVLDFTTNASGPKAGTYLADYGAEVVKVEVPGGEGGRKFAFYVNGISTYACGKDRGKKSIEIKLSDPDAQKLLLDVVKDYDVLIEELNRFLPYVNNWATCDSLSPKVFAKNKDRLISEIKRWISDGKTYTIRFGVGMLMRHYLDEAFDPIYPEMVSEIRSEEYYVNMMLAWYFATALAKQYDIIIPYLEEKRLPKYQNMIWIY